MEKSKLNSITFINFKPGSPVRVRARDFPFPLVLRIFFYLGLPSISLIASGKGIETHILEPSRRWTGPVSPDHYKCHRKLQSILPISVSGTCTWYLRAPWVRQGGQGRPHLLSLPLWAEAQQQNSGAGGLPPRGGHTLLQLFTRSFLHEQTSRSQASAGPVGVPSTTAEIFNLFFSWLT